MNNQEANDFIDQLLANSSIPSQEPIPFELDQLLDWPVVPSNSVNALDNASNSSLPLPSNSDLDSILNWPGESNSSASPVSPTQPSFTNLNVSSSQGSLVELVPTTFATTPADIAPTSNNFFIGEDICASPRVILPSDSLGSSVSGQPIVASSHGCDGTLANSSPSASTRYSGSAVSSQVISEDPILARSRSRRNERRYHLRLRKDSSH